MKKTKQQIIKEMTIVKDLEPTSQATYNAAIDHYTKCNNMTISELLTEADNEEDQRIRMRDRKIKNRLLTFRTYLQNQGKAIATVNSNLARIISLYHFYEFEVPKIPRLKDKNFETYDDIPKKKHVQQALQICNPQLQAIILFMLSSGCARNEVLHLTIGEFIKATKDYHNETTIQNVLNVLEEQSNVVPTFYIYRGKTDYPYVTFCSPEATTKIIIHLQRRLKKEPNIQNDDKVFDMIGSTFTEHFQRINDKMGWGWKGKQRFFHSHSLRKIFATELNMAGMQREKISFMSGRRATKIEETYLKTDAKKLKYIYMQYMKYITIYEKPVYKEINSKEKKELEELRKERKELIELKKELNMIKNRIDTIEK